MKFYFLFFIFFILISISFISANLSLNKGKLELNIQKGERMCKMVKVLSEDYVGEIQVRDIWSKDLEETNTNNYNNVAEDFGIDISYDEIKDFNEQSEIEVCFSGERVGDFRGALIFTPKAGNDQINVVVEVGTWLIINVIESNGKNSNGGSNGGSGGGSAITRLQDVDLEDGDEDEEVEEEVGESEIVEENLEEVRGGAGITGAVIGGVGNWKVILGVVIVLIIAIAIVYNRKK